MEKQKKRVESWWASQIAKKLEYKDLKSFSGVLDKTIQTFTFLDIPVFDNISPEMNDKKRDYKLSRFASYIFCVRLKYEKDWILCVILNNSPYAVVELTKAKNDSKSRTLSK